jgi:hypothetical protein
MESLEKLNDIASDSISNLALVDVRDDQKWWINIDAIYAPRNTISVIDCVFLNDFDAKVLMPTVSEYHMEICSGSRRWEKDIAHYAVTFISGSKITVMSDPRYELCFPVGPTNKIQPVSPINFKIPRKLLENQCIYTVEVTLSFSEIRCYSGDTENRGRKFVTEPIILKKVNDRWLCAPEQKIIVRLDVITEGEKEKVKVNITEPTKANSAQILRTGSI